MKVDRKSLLHRLEEVEPGLTTKEIVEQSSCYVFTKGHVITFNGEIYCRAESPLDIEGAVPARHLRDLLSKIPDETIDVQVKDNSLRIKAKGGRGSLQLFPEIALPIDQVEKPGRWINLHPEFCDAVSMVQACAAKDNDNYKITCVNITPDHVEACDNYQLSRYTLETGLIEGGMIKRDSIKHVPFLGMTEASETETWIHFRNKHGLQMSCRRWTEGYENLDKLIKTTGDGDPVTLPGGLSDALERNQVFARDEGDDEAVHVRLKDGKMSLRGESVAGWWEERKKIKYKGPDLSFLIAPKLLTEITEKGHDCLICNAALKVDGGKMLYMTCLEME